MAEFILGMNAKIYYGTNTTDTLTDLPELSNVKDVTLNLEAGEADVTTRANSGWRATAPTLRECTCEFEMVWKDSDAGFTAVKDAFLNATTLKLAGLTGDKGVANSEGPMGDFSITNFSRNEALEEAIMVSVTAKLAKFDQWVKTTGV